MTNATARMLSTALLAALVAVPTSASAEPGGGPRLISVCQDLLGPEEARCESVTEWRVEKTVDKALLGQPRRAGLLYTVRAIEGMTRYLLTMKSGVTVKGLQQAGTQIRGVVASLQRELQPGRFTTVASAAYGNVDLNCNCPFVDSGDLTVTMSYNGNTVDPSAPNLVEYVGFADTVQLALEATYDLRAGIVLPGDNVRIQTCIQYTFADEENVDGCFEDGGAIRSTRACSSFNFGEYANPEADVVVLREEFDGANKAWVGLSGFRVRSTSDNVTPTGTLLPVIPGGEPVSFELRPTGTPGVENLFYLQGDVSCSAQVGCTAGATSCPATITNNAIIDLGPDRGEVTATAVTDVMCAAIQCNAADIAGCDDGNPCTDDACIPGLGCQNTNRTGACEDGDICTATGQCNKGVCVVPPGFITCEDDGNPCTDNVCVPDVGCSAVPVKNRTTCDDNNRCTINDICVDGVCTSGSSVNCGDGNPCTIESCDPVTGCSSVSAPNRSPCDNGNPCTRDDICIAGQCISGSQVSCDDGNPCSIDRCIEGFGCVAVNAPNRAPCEDGNLCTANDLCINGSCVAGSDVSCDDNNPCTADACDSQFGCFYMPLTGACDDGNACTTASRCALGVCNPTEVLNCDDGNPCTVDRCDPVVGCVHETLSDGAVCDDGDPCSEGDRCVAGNCNATQVTVCDDGNECTLSTCIPGEGCVHQPHNGSCDDGNACTGDGLCANGSCNPGQPLSCDDGNPCTEDLCDAAEGCVYQPIANGTSCDDDDVCTAAGTCNAGQCDLGPANTCDDGNPCTRGQCDPVTGCVQLFVTGACSTGNACLTDGLCVGGTCVAGGAVVCNDNNTCTRDSCDPVGGCQHEARNAVPCDDGITCTVNDVCVAGQCVGGQVAGCDDNNPCTQDRCTANGCEHVPVSGACNDGNLCTVNDTCQNGTCVAGTARACDDGDSCTDDYCDPTTGLCAREARDNGATCDDGDGCTGCPWPEPQVLKGFMATSAAPDATLVPPGTAVLAIQLDGVDGQGTSLLLGARPDLRFIVLSQTVGVIRGSLVTVGGGATRTNNDTWTVEIWLNYRGIGRAGRGDPLRPMMLEFAQGVQGEASTDHWTFWDVDVSSTVRRDSTRDVFNISPDPFITAPVQVGDRANNRNLGMGMHGVMSWKLGNRGGRGSLRLDLRQVFCLDNDVCQNDECRSGSVAPSCRTLRAGDYCTWYDSDFQRNCTGGSSQQSGACMLARGFSLIRRTWSSCPPGLGVSFGVTRHRRLSFTTLPALRAFFPGQGWGATGTAELCNPPSTAATASASRAMALALSISLSDVGVAPSQGGVALGDLVWNGPGPCVGLSVREVVRRAEAIHSGASVQFGTCSILSDIDRVIYEVTQGFHNCMSISDDVILPR